MVAMNSVGDVTLKENQKYDACMLCKHCSNLCSESLYTCTLYLGVK